MLVFPNCKINLGLNVIAKRPDGYHNIETVFYPVSWCDALEIIDNTDTNKPFIFSYTGLSIIGNTEDNLVYKAWKLVSMIKNLPPIKVHLHKNLPMGAGLGGGSANAAYFINLLDTKYHLNFTLHEKNSIAKKIGADCCFFIQNKPVLANGRGDELSNIAIDLSNYYILVVFPNIKSNTKDAYDGITPKQQKNSLKSIIENNSINTWKELLINDFESTIFGKFPEIKNLKTHLYALGATYASMSGSGSSVFGIFEQEPNLNFPENYSLFLQPPTIKQ